MVAVEPSVLNELAKVSVEDLLLPLLIQLAIIIAAARMAALLFRRIGQPAVVGEIAAGLVLGPSVLGALAPSMFQAIFRPVVTGLPTGLGPGVPDPSDLMLGTILTALAQVGLVLLLFLIGMEFDFTHLRGQGRAALAISVTGIAAPFALGLGLGWVVAAPLGVPERSRLGFLLFMGTALSITAIPVLGRIMVELGIQRTRLAAVTISAAAIGDAAGWIMLAAVVALVRSAASPDEPFEAGRTLLMIAGTLAFGLFMFFVARPLLSRFARWALKSGNGEISLNALSVLLVLLFTCAITTSLIGIFAIFGAFLLGATLSGEHAFREAVSRRLTDFVTAFFLPVFFAYTGLRTDVGTLGSWQLWGIAAAVSGVAIVGKLVGCGVAARLSGATARESASIGVMMNTRGLMELVVINVGKDLGVIPDSMYCMLVLMAIVTTFMTTPVLVRLLRGTENEDLLYRSGYLKRPGIEAWPAEGSLTR